MSSGRPQDRFPQKKLAVACTESRLSGFRCRIFSLGLDRKAVSQRILFGGVPILALRDFEDFFEGEMRFNVLIGRDGLASGGDVVATFRDAQTMAEDLRSYMTASPRTQRFVQRLRILKRDRPPNEFVRQKYSRFQFEVS